MPNLQGIRRRIRSVKNMRQITKAMKLVSASKLARAQGRIVAARPYSRKLREMLNNLASRAGEYQHSLMEIRGDERYLVVLITSDKGLCGAFNTYLLKTALQFVKDNPNKQIDFLCIGRKARDFVRRRNFSVANEYVGLVSKAVTYIQGSEIGGEVIKLFTEEVDGKPRPDKVFILYNEFKSAIQQNQIFNQILPLTSINPQGEVDYKMAASATDYIYEQPPGEILSRLLPHYVETQIFTALLDSVAAEHGARMSAMDSASKNATEVINKLTLGMNRVRQAAITREIIEVVSGAAAL
ncbi:MAG: F-type H+-transporting ATPase subunit gamma [bacterium]|nr:MAG: F-type H+-transporting ATPase subunit gamma [bacterium]